MASDYSRNFAASMTGLNGYSDIPDPESDMQPITAGVGDPGGSRDPFYEASAKLAYFKGVLNDKLKQKNPEAYANFFKDLVTLRRGGDQAGAEKFVQESGYQDYLSPEEVQSTLGEDYQDYLNSIRQVNSYNVSQGKQPLYGTIEGENDLNKLNYGRRFAALSVTPSVSVTHQKSGAAKKYSRDYAYDPKTKKVSFTEIGDLDIRPDYLSTPTR